jgi:hypothetical protein
MRRAAGATVSAKVTAALTGFPGKPNAKTVFSEADSGAFLEVARTRVSSANVRGLPGFIITRPK